MIVSCIAFYKGLILAKKPNYEHNISLFTLAIYQTFGTLVDDNSKLHDIRFKNTRCKCAKLIANEYFARRGINDSLLEETLSTILQKMKPWKKHKNLEDKITTYESLISLTKTKNRTLFSLVSKVLWFISPHNWTMYDKFAKKGLAKITHTTFPSLDGIGFYRELEKYNFDTTINAMNAVLEDSKFNQLLPERIIDNYLMLLGGRFEERANYFKNNPRLLSSFFPEDFCKDLFEAFKNNFIPNTN